MLCKLAVIINHRCTAGEVCLTLPPSLSLSLSLSLSRMQLQHNTKPLTSQYYSISVNHHHHDDGALSNFPSPLPFHMFMQTVIISRDEGERGTRCRVALRDALFMRIAYAVFLSLAITYILSNIHSTLQAVLH